MPRLPRRLRRVGPVEIGSARDRRSGRAGYLAACTRNDCGWSAHYATPEAAELASRSHRCTPR
ncbi:mobile element transfer protein [Streptomyces calidiresistens]|uniref:Mobile element transfer n=1 Tax=Streptomyces calidiresistens TaxID=1485586 RepID=A0A7W3T9B5_9ACTN|nr:MULTISPECIES: mobile element transfer protein [Streptomyces]MBB0233116.1 Mobile element transfer [Streptomyces calidiresistens]MCE7079974.1 Mobile element transfer [Streptomyces sp. ST2-7A]